jgi:hypothetical protein
MAHNQYIVGVYKWEPIEYVYNHYVDGILQLSTDGKFIILNSSSESVFTSDFSDKNTFVINNVKNINNTYDVEIITNNKKFGIRFDRSSSAAYNEFIKEYHKIKERISGATRFYDSGRLEICGDSVNGLFTGNCIEYHDNKDNNVKYIGEFEDGEYDGSGEFFSECGLIRIRANNICNGVPNGSGNLYVCNTLIEKFQFDKNIQKLDTSSPNYCNQILKLIRDDHYDIYREGKFTSLDSNEKVTYLFKLLSITCDELDKTKSRLDKIEKPSWKLF